MGLDSVMELPLVEVGLHLNLVLCLRDALLSTAFTCVLPIWCVVTSLGGGGCDSPSSTFYILVMSHQSIYIGSTIVVNQPCRSPMGWPVRRP